MNAKLMQSLARAVILPTILAISLSGCALLSAATKAVGSITFGHGPEGGVIDVNFQPAKPRDLPGEALDCAKVESIEICRERLDLAIRYSCSGTMDPRAYAFCVRCVARHARDEAECGRLAETLVAHRDLFSTPLVVTGQPFAGDGTADPADHPLIGPLPPLNRGTDVPRAPAERVRPFRATP